MLSLSVTVTHYVIQTADKHQVIFQQTQITRTTRNREKREEHDVVDYHCGDVMTLFCRVSACRDDVISVVAAVAATLLPHRTQAQLNDETRNPSYRNQNSRDAAITLNKQLIIKC